MLTSSELQPEQSETLFEVRKRQSVPKEGCNNREKGTAKKRESGNGGCCLTPSTFPVRLDRQPSPSESEQGTREDKSKTRTTSASR